MTKEHHVLAGTDTQISYFLEISKFFLIWITEHHSALHQALMRNSQTVFGSSQENFIAKLFQHSLLRSILLWNREFYINSIIIAYISSRCDHLRYFSAIGPSIYRKTLFCIRLRKVKFKEWKNSSKFHFRTFDFGYCTDYI